MVRRPALGFAGRLKVCGITGIWGDAVLRGRDPGEVVTAMGEAIAARGPDSFGVWHDAGAALHLGHRRLAILDLSAQGHQPMVSASGRWAVTYNGEVYNVEALRAELDAAGPLAWRGRSDTEVLVAAVERWGLRAAVERFVGMFALALWDCSQRRLHLVRDRLGIKPLYYTATGGSFAFASTITALEVLPGFSPALSRHALVHYFRHNCFPGSQTVYDGVYRLAPGAILTLGAPEGTPRVERYWRPEDFARAQPPERTADVWLEHLEQVLRDAVSTRMVADVPLGAFLSGGVDSSAVVALMSELSTRRVQTFSIGFEDAAYDESSDARAVAEHLGTDHTELIATSRDMQEIIPSLARVYGEPFADSSQLPTLLVSRLARRSVKVALSGDGGDELFAGYNRHVLLPRLWERMEHLPQPVRAAIGRLLASIPSYTWDRLVEVGGPLLPEALRLRLPGDKIHKLARVLPARTPSEAYITLTSIWDDPHELVRGAHALPSPWQRGESWGRDRTAWVALSDLMGYMTDDVLTKVDRASMAVSLEARVPLLDHRVVECALQMPTELKIRQGSSKWALRQVLYQRVPRHLLERPKMGFGVPLHQWLRGSLRPWAEDLLNEGRMLRDGVLEPEPIRRLWSMHLSGRTNAQHRLWGVLMFQAWLRERPRALA
ncbi:MAG: asparagine synthase (glutamine-hydrolyzing), partial [Myxococcota bacterium]